jgi:hypothetical protein
LWRTLTFPLVAGLAVAGLLAGGPSQATVTRPGALAPAHFMPKRVNMLDCNGWSSKYQALSGSMGALCTDPITIKHGKTSRFIDNGWYVGHDEPSVKFISYAKGSGNTMTYYMTVPKDPSKAPTPNGSVTTYGELSVAPWFGLPLCDPQSYPQQPCRPQSDANIGTSSSPQAAGSAFMELQFYPPGFGSFVDSESCSATQWCAAMTIDSLECNFNFATCNPACPEPVNFAYLQTDGVPAGPPSPQLANVTTLIGNAQTLKINQGDSLKVSITDPPAGFTAVVSDMTTGQTGSMTASAANGFMNTSIKDCSGTPFTFRAEYNTAAPQNQVPWAALEGGVLMQEEIGHFESCNSVAFKQGFATGSGSESYVDPNVYQTCVGGLEGAKATGEGPCTVHKDGTITCLHATTQGPKGPTKCGTNDPLSGALCEFSDGYCFPKGSRPVVINGVPSTETAPVAGCFQNQFENGDLDFDGADYRINTWPDGSANHPTMMAISGPYTTGFATYPYIQFETDVGGSSALCNVATGANCLAPPVGAKFYPFFTLSESASNNGTCDWNFGKVIPGKTASSLGGYAQYGAADVARYGGTLTSAVTVNPATAFICDGTVLRSR